MLPGDHRSAVDTGKEGRSDFLAALQSVASIETSGLRVAHFASRLGHSSRGILVLRPSTTAIVLLAGVLPCVLPAHSQPRTPLDAGLEERAERRRAARSRELTLPLPGTPDTEKPLTRLAEAGVELGVPVLLRAFKLESQLEVWIEKEGRFVLYATYPVCFWSGKLGPKMREGDRQTPEGFYTVGDSQLHFGGRWRRSLDIGYPNVFDRVNGRTGSLILIHGGCDSIGCLAMTDAVKNELYDVVSAALRRGQRQVPVHMFPFRMTEANMAAHVTDEVREFWQDLKQGYDLFERTGLPPRISVCGKRYRIENGTPDVQLAGTVDLCRDDAVAAAAAAAVETVLSRRVTRIADSEAASP